MTANYHPSSPWTKERDELLKKLWVIGGPSAHKIARDWGAPFTASSIIGRTHRLGLPKRPARGYGLGRKDITAISPVLVKEDEEEPEPEVEQPKVEVAPVLELNGTGVSIERLRHGVCRWPLWSFYQEASMYCGKRCLPKQVYCEKHYKLAFVKTNPRVSPEHRRRIL